MVTVKILSHRMGKLTDNISKVKSRSGESQNIEAKMKSQISKPNRLSTLVINTNLE